jgi:hypothetical protein
VLVVNTFSRVGLAIMTMLPSRLPRKGAMPIVAMISRCFNVMFCFSFESFIEALKNNAKLLVFSKAGPNKICMTFRWYRPDFFHHTFPDIGLTMVAPENMKPLCTPNRPRMLEQTREAFADACGTATQNDNLSTSKVISAEAKIEDAGAQSKIISKI